MKTPLLQRLLDWLCANIGHKKPGPVTVVWHHAGHAHHRCARCQRIASKKD